MRAAFAWLARTGFIYLLLFAGIAFFVFAWPSLSSGFSSENWREDAMSVDAVRDALGEDRREAQGALQARVEEAGTLSEDALRERRSNLRAERDRIEAELSEGGGWFDAIRPSRILATKRLELRRAAIDAELGAIETAARLASQRSALGAAEAVLARYDRIPTTRAIAISRRLCREATTAIESFDEREQLDRAARNVILRERALLEDDRDEKCGNAERRARDRERGIEAREQVAQLRASLAAAQDVSAANLPDPASGISDTTLRDIAWRALLALIAVLLVPFLIRILFYYVLAPLVERGPPIRLARPTGMGAVPQASGGSRPTLSLTLGESEELLVRQSYLQSSPAGAEMRTQWLLSWRNILTSLASGMAFLTRAQGAGTTFGISARDDPFAEIARIDLPATTSLVMQPRALAAVVQPVGRPIQIRSKWRLFSLHAWLTFQFRYLVFHGPGTLIVKGGRGVRVERAQDGRRFGQDQLIGFSADTAYTVARSETFLPYFFGREPLFRDRVKDMDGKTDGILVIEEAPMAGRRKGVRGGLEGAFDAVLKAFGV